MLLAIVNYWLAVCLAAVATALVGIVWFLVESSELSGGFLGSRDALRYLALFVAGVLAISIVVGSILALVRLPFLRRRLERRVLTETGARPGDRDEHRRVANLLEGIAIGAGVPPPRFVLVEDPVPNAFGIGTRASATVVGVTTGLIDELTRDELEAVLAYEVSRIANYDLALCTWTVALTAGALDALDDELKAVIGFLPVRFALWMQAWSLRGVPAERDRIAIGFTRHPHALVRALEKLHEHPGRVRRVSRATAPLWVEYPVGLAGRSRAARRLTAELGLDRRIAAMRAEAGLPPSPSEVAIDDR